MKISTCTRYWLGTTVLVLLSPGLPAAESAACSSEDFRGTYAFYTQGTVLPNNAPVMFASTLRANGKGAITEWKDWIAQSTGNPAPPFKQVLLRDVFENSGRDIRYVVEPDCRLTITAEVAAPVPGGKVPVVLVGGLAAGGKEALLINGAPASPYLTLTTMKRAESTEGQVIRALSRIANRLGLEPPEN